jgi:hypothetical protein
LKAAQVFSISISIVILMPLKPAPKCRQIVFSSENDDRGYVFFSPNIFNTMYENFLTFSVRITGSFCKKWTVTLLFKNNDNFFRRKLAKIAEN